LGKTAHLSSYGPIKPELIILRPNRETIDHQKECAKKAGPFLTLPFSPTLLSVSEQTFDLIQRFLHLLGGP
jgi:hypothetical protein